MGYYLWYDASIIPNSTWDYLIGEQKFIFGWPLLLAAMMGWILNIMMFFTMKQKVSKEIKETFFFWTLLQLSVMNMIQLFNHASSALSTLSLDYESYWSILPFAFSFGGCFASDFLRGVISIHRLLLITIPFKIHLIPSAFYIIVLLFDLAICIGIITIDLMPSGGNIWLSNELSYWGFYAGESIIPEIWNQTRITCNYINLVAGAITYSVLAPLVFFRKRQSKTDLAFVFPLFFTFCCSVLCWFIWEFGYLILPSTHIPDDASDEEFANLRLLAILNNFISYILWILQCSQEPGVLFLFNKNFRKEMIPVLICYSIEGKTGQKKGQPLMVTSTTKA